MQTKALEFANCAQTLLSDGSSDLESAHLPFRKPAQVIPVFCLQVSGSKVYQTDFGPREYSERESLQVRQHMYIFNNALFQIIAVYTQQVYL